MNFSNGIIQNIRMNKQSLRMQEIKRQNQRMSRIIQSYLSEIERQRRMNEQHQEQIQGLLKFNERLLYVIETQVANNRADTGSLVPISERSQRQSDLINPLNSLIKTKRTLAARSQKCTKSVAQNNGAYVARLQALGKNLQNSEYVPSQEIDNESYLRSVKNKSHHPPLSGQHQRKYSHMTTIIQGQISGEMKSLNNCAQKNAKFYEHKISQLKDLSTKIGTFKPEDKFEQISKKIQMSPGTANLVKKAMMTLRN